MNTAFQLAGGNPKNLALYPDPNMTIVQRDAKTTSAAASDNRVAAVESCMAGVSRGL
jgi:hypothetical protein